MKTLPSLRVSERTLDNMKMAITIYNKKSLFKINQNDFRRMSLELLSQLIIQEKEIPVEIIKE